jgi:hypothetical protein
VERDSNTRKEQIKTGRAPEGGGERGMGITCFFCIPAALLPKGSMNLREQLLLKGYALSIKEMAQLEAPKV